MLVIANVLQPLIDVCNEILKFWHDTVGFKWGTSIIGLTIVVRLAILPLTFKGVKGMQEMQRLQPEMKKVQERYKDDRQRMNQEMMKLYQEHGVNPLSSCLPLLLQFPFFIALFYLLRSKEFHDEVRSDGEEAFLFIDSIIKPATGGVLVILIVTYVTTQLISTMITSVNADKTQRRIFMALPFLFVPVVINFEAGLLVYWITTNVWTIGQQLLVRKLYPKPPPIESSDEKPVKRKAGAAAATASGGDGKQAKKPVRAPAAKGRKAEAVSEGKDNGSTAKPPPQSPRKKKKRSGRRR
jgi:YidC/Oxa1 family membrane protein insertase